MPSFHYKALTKDGSVVENNLSATDRGDALKQLQKLSLRPITVTEKDKVLTTQKKESSSANTINVTPARETNIPPAGDYKLKKAEIILFTEELSDMLSSGLQLEPALKVLSSRSEKGNIRSVSQELRNKVRDGVSFHQALKLTSPHSFGNLYCSLAAAGEASGSLDKILKRQAEHMITIQAIQSQVMGALIYPVFILAVVFFLCLFVLFFLLPQLVGLMKNMPGSKVPFLASFLMGLTIFLKSYWLYLIAGLGALIFSFKIWKDTPSNKATWDETKFKLPFFGKLLKVNFYVLFMETLANLISNGLPIVRCLELARDATDNLFAQSKIEKLIDQVGDGRALSQSLLKTELFPPVIVDMVVVGEQTGRLDVALANAARRSDKELKQTINRLMALMTPLILCVLAVVIGSVLLLIFGLIGETINNIKR